MSTLLCLGRRLKRLERRPGVTALCPLCRGEGDLRVVLVHAALGIVERRGCACCGRLRHLRRALFEGSEPWL